MPEQLIDIKELSRRLSVTKGVLYNRVNKRRIPFFKLGRSVRFDYAEVIRSLPHSSVLDGETVPPRVRQ
jgi:excisionase family DNA binding protein